MLQRTHGFLQYCAFYVLCIEEDFFILPLRLRLGDLAEMRHPDTDHLISEY